jgi:L-fuconolactonase
MWRLFQTLKIDSHQHFWHYDPPQYGWIDDAMRSIRRDFLPQDLSPLAKEAGIAGTVAIQARQTTDETDWLLDLAESHPALIRGVVGWLPLRDCGALIGASLDSYASRPAFKGVRHVLQGEADAFMADAAFNAAVAELPSRSLTYDLLIVARQLPVALQFVDRHPNLSVALDHIAKPVIRGAPADWWVRQIRALARRDSVFCKFSGVVTEVPGWEWSPELLYPYFEVVLEAFGPTRLMFGSDWPVCQVAADYVQWHRFVTTCVAPLSAAEREAILGGNAVKFYRLASPTYRLSPHL